MKKELISKEGIEKVMPNKQNKQLSLEEQLQKDILGYSQQIVNLTVQINQFVGTKMQAD